jgi:hypothetical protein
MAGYKGRIENKHKRMRKYGKLLRKVLKDKKKKTKEFGKLLKN